MSHRGTGFDPNETNGLTDSISSFLKVSQGFTGRAPQPAPVPGCRYLAIPWYSGFGAMAVAEAMRFDMA